MELGVPLSLPGGLARRVAPIACGGALVAATAFLATHDPAAGNSLFPQCIFHQTTGLWCPGCGLTRGIHQLLHGHIGAALGYNIFTPVAVVAVAIAWLGWLRVAWGGPPLRVPRWAGRWLTLAVPIVILSFGALRNLPVAPFRALAP